MPTGEVSATSETVQLPTRRLDRAVEGRLVAGVAAGLAEHLGLSRTVVRVAFLILGAAGGVGALAYAAFWALVPVRGGGDAEREQEWGRLLAGLVLLAGVSLGLLSLGVDITGSAGLPALAVVVGAALMWRQADAGQRARWRASAGSGRGHVARVVGGAVLLMTGLIGFLASRGQLSQARQGIVATVVVVGGLALMSGPWWVRMAAELREERRERIRSEERAEFAAHVHDSVLQTLLLIRKASSDPREVTRLSRLQERELRAWLYERADREDLRLGASVERVAAEVEEAYGVPVEAVVVGDCPVDGRLEAALAAAREALVNAARHSGAAEVSLYAEVEASRVTLFVRDRGKGFDPAKVPAGRFGLSQSVHGRLERHGGGAEVRSTIGQGTEVRLEVPRA